VQCLTHSLTLPNLKVHNLPNKRFFGPFVLVKANPNQYNLRIRKTNIILPTMPVFYSFLWSPQSQQNTLCVSQSMLNNETCNFRY